MKGYGYNPMKFEKIKFKCQMNGCRLTAGGIFFYDKVNHIKGLWLLKEKDKNEEVYTDFGGKYDYNDGDIYATISREFREETFNTEEISYKKIVKVPHDHHIYIKGFDDRPIYLCMAVYKGDYKLKFDQLKLKSEKQKILDRNQFVPPNWYTTISIEFIPLAQLHNVQLSGRFKQILKEVTKNISNYSHELQYFFGDFKYE